MSGNHNSVRAGSRLICAIERSSADCFAFLPLFLSFNLSVFSRVLLALKENYPVFLCSDYLYLMNLRVIQLMKCPHICHLALCYQVQVFYCHMHSNYSELVIGN